MTPTSTLKIFVIDLVETRGIKRAKDFHDKRLQSLHRIHQIIEVEYYKHTY